MQLPDAAYRVAEHAVKLPHVQRGRVGQFFAHVAFSKNRGGVDKRRAILGRRRPPGKGVKRINGKKTTPRLIRVINSAIQVEKW